VTIGIGVVMVNAGLADTWQRQGGELRRGAIAMVPLWAGVVPFALAFALLARAAGFSPLATVLLSLTVFAGAAQVAIVNLVSAGSSAIAIVLTVLALNLRHILYGLSLKNQLGATSRRERAAFAYVLTDEAYGVTIRDSLDGGGGPGFYLGASLSLFGVFNLTTIAGVLLGQLLPDPSRLGLGFIFPLTFLALLLPLLRGWRQWVVAIVTAVAALLLKPLVAGGLATLLAAACAAALGVGLERLRPRERTVR
jgi:4-azaleucine resistance transporter AzlC